MTKKIADAEPAEPEAFPVGSRVAERHRPRVYGVVVDIAYGLGIKVQWPEKAKPTWCSRSELITEEADRRRLNNPHWHRRWGQSVGQRFSGLGGFNIPRPTQKPQGEERSRQQLAKQMIDAGFKAMAAKLHPDVGGSHESMVLLTQIRRMLKGVFTDGRK